MDNIITVKDIEDKKISLSEARNMAIMHQGEIFKYFDEGCTRYVFCNADRSKVIKLVKHEHGKDWNAEEADIYKNATPEDRTLMVRTELINGFIEQDFVLPVKYGGRKLTREQIYFSNSCRNEVGWSEDGTIVCFDLDEFKKY